MFRLGWFSTGRDAAARTLLREVVKRIENGFFDVSIEFVFCNWEEGEAPEHKDYRERQKFFSLVREYDIPLITLSWRRFMPELRKKDMERWRAEYGKKLRELLAPYDFDLGVLAGYMLWVDDETCRTYDLINLHPALPGGPKGTWQEVIWQIIEKRAERHGAMIHLTTPEWDEGPPLTYCSFSLRTPEYLPLWEQLEKKLQVMDLESIRSKEGEREPLFQKIRADGEIREIPLLAHSIKILAEGRVYIKDQHLFEGERKLDSPYDLTEQVDEEIQKED